MNSMYLLGFKRVHRGYPPFVLAHVTGNVESAKRFLRQRGIVLIGAGQKPPRWWPIIKGGVQNDPDSGSARTER